MAKASLSKCLQKMLRTYHNVLRKNLSACTPCNKLSIGQMHALLLLG